MDVYLVGGAVRDHLLGTATHDRDYVVVGANPDQMLALGFEQVGADFPVFLHPITHDEYALARTERKIGAGYQGFCVTTDQVSLADDLLRRDLTINAMAIALLSLDDPRPSGNVIIDPYGGQRDLEHGILRHVSPAFSEDPLRVLRTARFFARYYEQSFVIDASTTALMRQIANQGQLSELSRERIWVETAKALTEVHGARYFDILDQLGILRHISPTLARRWQEEDKMRALVLDTLPTSHSILTTSTKTPPKTLSTSDLLKLKFAILMLVCKDAKTPLAQSLGMIRQICQDLHAPKAVQHFAELFVTHIEALLAFERLDGETLLTLIEHSKAHKASRNQPDCPTAQSSTTDQHLGTLALLICASGVIAQHLDCLADDAKALAVTPSPDPSRFIYKGTDSSKIDDTDAKLLHLERALDHYHAIGMADIETGLQGKAIGDALRQARIQALDALHQKPSRNSL